MNQATYNWVETRHGLTVQRIENGKVVDALTCMNGLSGRHEVVYHFPIEYDPGPDRSAPLLHGGCPALNKRKICAHYYEHALSAKLSSSEPFKVDKYRALEEVLRSRDRWEKDRGINNEKLSKYIGQKVIVVRGVKGNPIFETTKGILAHFTVDGLALDDINGRRQEGCSLKNVTRIILME